MDPKQAGEIREQLSRLWMQAEPAVNAYVFAAVHRFQGAEDVVQQVALAAIRGLGALAGQVEDRRPLPGAGPSEGRVFRDAARPDGNAIPEPEDGTRASYVGEACCRTSASA